MSVCGGGEHHLHLVPCSWGPHPSPRLLPQRPLAAPFMRLGGSARPARQASFHSQDRGRRELSLGGGGRADPITPHKQDSAQEGLPSAVPPEGGALGTNNGAPAWPSLCFPESQGKCGSQGHWRHGGLEQPLPRRTGHRRKTHWTKRLRCGWGRLLDIPPSDRLQEVRRK